MSETRNQLFLVPVRIRRGPSSEMPPHMVGAIVDCFVAAPDHLSAVQLAATALRHEGHIFEDLLDGKVHQLDPSSWPGYLERQYPQLAGQLPRQPDVMGFLNTGGVFFGPFLGWERDASGTGPGSV